MLQVYIITFTEIQGFNGSFQAVILKPGTQFMAVVTFVILDWYSARYFGKRANKFLEWTYENGNITKMWCPESPLGDVVFSILMKVWSDYQQFQSFFQWSRTRVFNQIHSAPRKSYVFEISNIDDLWNVFWAQWRILKLRILQVKYSSQFCSAIARNFTTHRVKNKRKSGISLIMSTWSTVVL